MNKCVGCGDLVQEILRFLILQIPHQPILQTGYSKNLVDLLLKFLKKLDGNINGNFMKFKIKYSKHFRMFWIKYAELHGRGVASFEIHLLRIAAGVMFRKDVKATSRYAIDIYDDEM